MRINIFTRQVDLLESKHTKNNHFHYFVGGGLKWEPLPHIAFAEELLFNYQWAYSAPQKKKKKSRPTRYDSMNLRHYGPDFLHETTFPDEPFVTYSSSYWLRFIAQHLMQVWLASWHLLLWDWEYDFGFDFCLCLCLPFSPSSSIDSVGIYQDSILCQALVQHCSRVNAVHILCFS